MTMRLPARRALTAQRSSSRARRASRAGAVLEGERQRGHGGARAAAQAPQLRPLGLGTGVRVARSPDLRAVGSARRARARRRRRSAGRACRCTTIRPTWRPMSSRSASLQGERLVDRHLLGPGHRDDARPFRVGEHRVDRTALAGDAAHAGGLREGSRRAQHGDAVAGGGRVEDDEVVGLGARRAAVLLRQLPDLADRQQLAHARRRGREVAERAARPEQLGQRRRQLVGQVQLHRVLGVDRQVVQAGRELLLVHALAAQGARDVVAARDLGDDRAQPAAGGHEPERSRHRRLADPALPRDDDQLTAQQSSAQISPSQ